MGSKPGNAGNEACRTQSALRGRVAETGPPHWAHVGGGSFCQCHAVFEQFGPLVRGQVRIHPGPVVQLGAAEQPQRCRQGKEPEGWSASSCFASLSFRKRRAQRRGWRASNVVRLHAPEDSLRARSGDRLRKAILRLGGAANPNAALPPGTRQPCVQMLKRSAGISSVMSRFS
jgi:hypothetical protein